jgi:hypothetical protein
MKIQPLALLLVLPLAGAACGVDAAPSARVKTATPDRLVAADDALDDLLITVEYEDGDGDLGTGTAQVHDCRAEGLRTDLVIPVIAQEALIGEPISGTLELHVNDVGALAAATVPEICRDLGVDSVGAGAAVFCVTLVDAAGHEGDGDCTGEIAVMAE